MGSGQEGVIKVASGLVPDGSYLLTTVAHKGRRYQWLSHPQIDHYLMMNSLSAEIIRHSGGANLWRDKSIPTCRFADFAICRKLGSPGAVPSQIFAD